MLVIATLDGMSMETPEGSQMNQLRFDARTVVVTGAGSGLGEVYARLLASRGAAVVITDVDSRADDVAASIRKDGGSAIGVRGSVASVEDAEGAVAAAIDAFGRVDALINNAGIGFERPFMETSIEDIRRVMEVHYFGTVHMTRAVWPHFAAQGYGRILNITSANIFGLAGWAHYGAAKAAVLGLARGLAVEGEDLGIAVNVLAPAALTRMLTDNITDAGILASVANAKPALVGPLAAYLVHESMPFTGRTFFSGSGHISDIFLTTSQGATDSDMTIESAAELLATEEFHEGLVISSRTIEQTAQQSA